MVVFSSSTDYTGREVFYSLKFSYISIIISADEDPSLRTESFANINLRDVCTKLNW